MCEVHDAVVAAVQAYYSRYFEISEEEDKETKKEQDNNKENTIHEEMSGATRSKKGVMMGTVTPSKPNSSGLITVKEKKAEFDAALFSMDADF